MAQALHEIARVCRDGARAVVVVGRESNVRKTQFFNGDIVANLAVRSLGWSFVLRQEREFMNRFGSNIREDVLHFEVKKPPLATRIEPREIAREALTEARGRVPDETRADLEEALSSVADVKPSPLFDHTEAPVIRNGDPERAMFWPSSLSRSQGQASGNEEKQAAVP